MTRRRLTERQVLTVLLQGGALIKCALCPYQIRLEDVPNVQRDHYLPIGLGGGDDLGNQGFAHFACHAEKTRRDQGQMAKADRQKLKHETGRSSARLKRKLIKSRGFSKGLRKKFDGTVEKVS